MVISLQVPDNAHTSDFEVRMIVAAKLFDAGRVSAGQAAEMVGISKRTFIELLGQYGVSIFGYTFEELEEDLEHVWSNHYCRYFLFDRIEKYRSVKSSTKRIWENCDYAEIEKLENKGFRISDMLKKKILERANE